MYHLFTEQSIELLLHSIDDVFYKIVIKSVICIIIHYRIILYFDLLDTIKDDVLCMSKLNGLLAEPMHWLRQGDINCPKP